MFEKKERQIREQRTRDAMVRGYMGENGKLVKICRNFGKPIISQGSPHISSTKLPDLYNFNGNGYDESGVITGGEYKFGIPVFSEDSDSYEVGYHFEAMKYGFHLEITWKEATREVICKYKGKCVYHEMVGELEMFSPKEEWEKIIDDLFEKTKKQERQNKKEQNKIQEEKLIQEQFKFLEEMKVKWGI